MNRGITKNAIKQSIVNYWWIYFLVAVLVCGAWLYAFYLKDRVRDDERLQIFVAGDIVNYDIEQSAENYFSDRGILDVTLYVLSPDFKGFDSGFSAQGFLNSDLLILPQHLVEKYATNALALDGLLALPQEAQTYKVDKTTYAIKVGIANADGYTHLYGFDWIEASDEDMYVLISPKSKNIDKDSNKTQALQLLQLLLNDEL